MLPAGRQSIGGALISGTVPFKPHPNVIGLRYGGAVTHEHPRLTLSNTFNATADFAANMVRLGWFTGVGLLADRTARQAGYRPASRPADRTVPDRDTVMADIIDLFRRRC